MSDDETNDQYGTDTFGDGPFGGAIGPQDNVGNIIDNLPLRAMQPVPPRGNRGSGNTLWRFLNVFAHQLDNVDSDLETVSDQLFIESATTDALERRGAAIGEGRPTGEPNDTYRKRLQGAYGAAASDSTLADFSEVLLNVLNTDESRVRLLPDATTNPEVVVEVDSGVVGNSPFTATEITEFMKDTVPADDGVTVREFGTFEFADTINDSITPGSSKGFNNGTFGGSIS